MRDVTPDTLVKPPLISQPEWTNTFERRKVQVLFTNTYTKNNKKCLRVNNDDSFDIIDHARTRFGLKLKEALHIKWNEPHLDLNKQVRHEVINITV